MRLGLSQSGLERKSGIDQASISNAERDALPAEDTLRQIVDALGLRWETVVKLLPSAYVNRPRPGRAATAKTFPEPVLKNLPRAFIEANAPSELQLFDFFWEAHKSQLGRLQTSLRRDSRRRTTLKAAALAPSAYGQAVAPQVFFAVLSVLGAVAEADPAKVSKELPALVDRAIKEYVLTPKIADALRPYLMERLVLIVG
jgi:transcriptional regulator with XRE-family HTH domain